MRRSDAALVAVKSMVDTLAVWGGITTAYWLRFSYWDALGLSQPASDIAGFHGWALLLTVGIVVLLALQGAYTQRRFRQEVHTLFWALTAAVGAVLLLFFLGRIFFFSRFVFGAAWGLSYCFLVLGRLLVRQARRAALHLGYGKTRVVLIAHGGLGQQMQTALARSPYYDLVKTIPDAAQLPQLLRSDLDEVILASHHVPDRSALMALCHRRHVAFRFVPEEVDFDLAEITNEELGGIPLLTLHAHAQRGGRIFLKALLDRTGALLGGLLLSPLLLWISWRIWRSDTSAPICYASTRVGQGGRVFQCLKFRSMVPNADSIKQQLESDRDSIFFKKDNDPRVTPFGQWLRRTSLDELPQLLNVLKGDMSLVGPRPHIPEEVEQYHLDDHRILSVKPGMTGWAAVNGRSTNSYDEETRLEMYYVQNWSLLLDLHILWRTVWVVLNQENVS